MTLSFVTRILFPLQSLKPHLKDFSNSLPSAMPGEVSPAVIKRG
jgi:hypothetical protein